MHRKSNGKSSRRNIFMNQLISHITYLLDRHDCVTVPGLGTYLVHHSPARIDSFTKTILPPSRRVTFNSEASFDDSLLVSSYARKNSLNYSDALEMMRGDVATFKEMLQAGGKAEISGVGSVFMTPEKNISFTSDDSILSMSGLKSISLPASVVVENVSPVIEPVSASEGSRFSRTMHSAMKYAAMIVMFISLAIVFSTPVNVNDADEIVKANLCPFEADEVEEEVFPDLLIASPSIVVEDNTEEFQSTATPREGDYILVIGSLVTSAQAEQFLKEVGSDAMGVIEHNGRYRVYGAFSDSRSEVMNSALLAKYPDAWPMAVPCN